MLKTVVAAAAAASVGIILLHGAPATLRAQGPEAALTGTVRSQEEGVMEGVVVSARRDGAHFTVSVVSDADGRYTFPRTHLEPGSYALSIRAVGYDLPDPGPVDVTGSGAATADLRLRPTANLAKQLSSREWALSFPGTKAQKDKLVYQLLSCAYCHTYQRIVHSEHTAEGFVNVINRMGSFYPDGAALSNDNSRGRALRNTEEGQFFVTAPDWGFTPGVPKPELAEYLATVNLSGGKETWDYALQTLPRPTGAATRVIVTQYDFPAPGTVSHDLDVTPDGIVWYTDESAQILGRFDPETAEFTEYDLPPVNEGDLPGTRDIQVGADGRLWFFMRVPGSGHQLAVFDPETEDVTLADEQVRGQFLALGPDGKIWCAFQRVDPDTLEMDGQFDYQDHVPPGVAPYAGNSKVDSQGNAWMVSNRGPGGVMKADGATGEVSWYPIEGVSGRRGRIDDQDRLWYAEYLRDKILMFDTRSLEAKRWNVPLYSTPYTASSPDANGYVYASSNMSERLLRLDPDTGEVIGYQMPTEFDTKKILHDPTTDRTVLWMSNTRAARLVKVELLD